MLNLVKIIEGEQPILNGPYQGRALKELEKRINEVIYEYEEHYEVVNVEISYMPLVYYPGEIHHHNVVAILKMRLKNDRC